MSTKTSRSSRRAARGSNDSRRHRGQNANAFVTKRMMNGGRFTPPSNPPDVTYIPWNNLTLVISHNAPLSFKVNDIKRYLRLQVDPTNRGFNPVDKGDGRFVVQYRLHKVTAWNLTGRVIALSIDDFIDSAAAGGGRDQLCGLVDTGTSIHTPAVGYILPISHAHHVLRTDDKQSDDILFDVSAPDRDQCITYLNINYRFDGPAKHPSVISPIGEVARTLNALSNKIMKHKDSSTLDLVINGIKYTAEAVAVLSTGISTCPGHNCSNPHLCDASIREDRSDPDKETIGSVDELSLHGLILEDAPESTNNGSVSDESFDRVIP